MLTLLVMLACKGGEDPDDSEPIDTGDPLPTDVCERWDAIRSQYQMASWDGSVDTCDVGTVTTDDLTLFKQALNVHRWMAGLQPVALDTARSLKAQECALMMHANDDLDDTPPESWDCYSAEGAEAAGASLLSGSGGVYAIDLAMGGNADGDDELSGRRWLLSNQLTTVGTGFTDRFTCIWLEVGGDSGQEWVAWPPPGQIVHEAVQPLDTGGWSWQSDTMEILLTPTVRVEMDGENMPVTVKVLDENYGSKSAFKFTPNGWRVERDKTYHVTITGLGDPIAYDVEVLGCR